MFCAWLTGPQTEGKQYSIFKDGKSLSLDSIVGTLIQSFGPRQIAIMPCTVMGPRSYTWFLLLGYLLQAFISTINSFTFPTQVSINRSINPAFYNPLLFLFQTIFTFLLGIWDSVRDSNPLSPYYSSVRAIVTWPALPAPNTKLITETSPTAIHHGNLPQKLSSPGPRNSRIRHQCPFGKS